MVLDMERSRSILERNRDYMGTRGWVLPLLVVHKGNLAGFSMAWRGRGAWRWADHSALHYTYEYKRTSLGIWPWVGVWSPASPPVAPSAVAT